MNPGLFVARLLAVLLLGAATLAILRPFLQPMAWAAILAYVTWPLFDRLRQRVRRPQLAAVAFTAGVVVCIGLPTALLLAALADDASSLVQALRAWRQQGGGLPVWLAEAPWFEQLREHLRRTPIGDPAQVSEWFGTAGTAVSKRLVSLAGGVVRNVFSFGVMLVTLCVFYLNGEAVAAVGRRMAPRLFPYAPARFVERIGQTVRGVVIGLLGTAAVQGTLAGIGLAVAGVPSPIALGALSALVSFLPGGSAAIPLLSAAWLGLSGEPVAAIGLALWGVLVVGTADNFLRPILISGQAEIPFLLVFFGVIGGLASFGVIGLFAGPILLSVAFTLVRELTREPAAPPPRPEEA